MKAKIAELGMKQIYLPFGSKFPHPNTFMPEVMKFSPSQIFIHCEHGSDRTGAILAYILTTRHNWLLPKALHAVALPSFGDIQTLDRILRANDFDIAPGEYDDFTGIYSAEKNGGYGGLKIRSEGGSYINLIQTLIKRTRTPWP